MLSYYMGWEQFLHRTGSFRYYQQEKSRQSFFYRPMHKNFECKRSLLCFHSKLTDNSLILSIKKLLKLICPLFWWLLFKGSFDVFIVNKVLKFRNGNLFIRWFLKLKNSLFWSNNDWYFLFIPAKKTKKISYFLSQSLLFSRYNKDYQSIIL